MCCLTLDQRSLALEGFDVRHGHFVLAQAHSRRDSIAPFQNCLVVIADQFFDSAVILDIEEVLFQ
jgi:hypothetical protein